MYWGTGNVLKVHVRYTVSLPPSDVPRVHKVMYVFHVECWFVNPYEKLVAKLRMKQSPRMPCISRIIFT